MTRRQIILLALLALVAAGVGFLLIRNKQAPYLPADEEHASFVNADLCIECHARDGVVPQSPNHPIGRRCMQCHGMAP
jgi:cytochrome c553